MKQELVNEIIACLGGERTLFHYYQDRYCIDLLQFEMQKREMGRAKISQLKQLIHIDFTKKPGFSEVLKHFGDGTLSQQDFYYFLPENAVPFVLTLDKWGDGDRGWDQTTRNQSNLVLQLNFNRQHLMEFNRLIKPSDAAYGPFEYDGHPIRHDGLKTMSWVRMDVDFESDCVLIEEIQNDWIRKAETILAIVRRRATEKLSTDPVPVHYQINGSYEDLENYVENTLKPYKKIWAEASLTAAIQFIRNELGIRHIYYHTFETGCKIKQVMGKPPRSIYTKLPKQFGFCETNEAPAFLLQHKWTRRRLKSIKEPKWYRLH
ncbi:hypothetical protein TDB9533_03126 [Thalassocella blandensis]|nr:hypothetical protein TDB9533_03126 [Thalassocella blandensis]